MESKHSITPDYTDIWRNSLGQYHREAGPAVEYVSGTKAWYLFGQLHREDGPAIEYVNGDKLWYVNGKLHREDGPTVELANGDKEWWVNGIRYTTEKRYWFKIYDMGLITKEELFLKLL